MDTNLLDKDVVRRSRCNFNMDLLGYVSEADLDRYNGKPVFGPLKEVEEKSTITRIKEWVGNFFS